MTVNSKAKSKHLPSADTSSKRISKPSASKKQQLEDASAQVAKMVKTAAKKKTRDARRAQKEKENANPNRDVIQEKEARIANLEKQLAEIKEQNQSRGLQNAELKRANQELRSQATQAKTKSIHPDSSIPRPKGIYSIRKEMGLGAPNQRPQFKDIQAKVRNLARAGGLDFNESWKGQDLMVIGKINRAAAEAEPYLKRFAKNWATCDIIQQYLNNVRNYERGKQREGSAFHRRRIRDTEIGRREDNEGILDQRADNESISESNMLEDDEKSVSGSGTESAENSENDGYGSGEDED